MLDEDGDFGMLAQVVGQAGQDGLGEGEEFTHAAAEPGLIVRVGGGNGAQGLFHGVVQGYRGRELVGFILGLGQVINSPLQQV